MPPDIVWDASEQPLLRSANHRALAKATEGDRTTVCLVAHRDREVLVHANLAHGTPHQKSSVCVAETHTPSAKSITAPTGYEDSDWSSPAGQYDVHASLRLAHEP